MRTSLAAAVVALVGALAMCPAPGLAASVEARGGMRVGGVSLPVASAHVEIVVEGAIAHVVVRHRFVNPRTQAIEAVYVFPVPEDAAVGAMTMRIVDGATTRTITSQIERRDRARARYEAAVAAGVVGGIVEAERPNVFTQSVTGIAAGATIDVELSWDAPVHRLDGRWELVIPTVVGPRHVPGTATGGAASGGGWSPDTDQVPDASRVTPPVGKDAAIPVTARIELSPGATIIDVASPTHDLEVATRRGSRLAIGAEHAVVTLAGGAVRSDGDLVVRWRTDDGEAPVLRATAAPSADGGHVALLVTAPVAQLGRPSMDLVIAVDRSRSLEGSGLAMVRQTLRAIVGTLRADDELALVGLGHDRKAMDKATTRTKATAQRHIDRLEAGGDGDLVGLLGRAGEALGEGTCATKGKMVATEEFRGSCGVIVLVTDGLVANEEAVLAEVERLHLRVVTLGVGAAPNRWLLAEIAARSGGVGRVIAAADDADMIAAGLAAELGAAALAGLTVDWGGLDVDGPLGIQDLVSGRAVQILAHVRKPGRGTVTVRAVDRSGRAVALTAPVSIASGAGDPWLARLWARARIAELIAGGGDGVAITQLALAHGLVSPSTALVAIDQRVVVDGGVQRTIEVPVALPMGMQFDAVFGLGGDAGEDREEGERIDLPQGAPPMPVDVYDDLSAQGESIMVASGRTWQLQTSFTAGAALDDRALALVGSLRLQRDLAGILAIGPEVAVAAVPGADEGAINAAILASLSRSFLFGMLTVDAGAGLVLGDGVGPGYDLALEVGRRRLAGVLRWDGAIVDGDHRGILSAGVGLRW